jgi:hypothetical protein
MNLIDLYNINKYPECFPIYNIKSLRGYNRQWMEISGFAGLGDYTEKLEPSWTSLVIKEEDWDKYEKG